MSIRIRPTASEPEFVRIVDGLRRKGLSYDDVMTRVQRVGIDPAKAKSLLADYANELDEKGRPRGQVNLGDPAEK